MEVQELARSSFRILLDNPTHPSLRLKKMASLWSARVGMHHRALAEEDELGFCLGLDWNARRI